MEEKVTEIVKRILDSKSINLEDLNEVIQLHEKLSQEKYSEMKPYWNAEQNSPFDFLSEYVEDEESIRTKNILEEISQRYGLQMNRLEMAILEKIKQLNYHLSKDFIDQLGNMLFHRDKLSKVIDIRVVAKNEIAILRENGITIGDSFNEIDSLDDLSIQEEAYLTKAAKLQADPDYSDPSEEFPEVYSYVQDNTQELLEELGIYENGTTEFLQSLDEETTENRQGYIPSKEGETNIYFNTSMWDFYEGNLSAFKMIVTVSPNTIKLYDVKITDKGWIGKEIDSDDKFSNTMDGINCSLLTQSDFMKYLKSQYASKNRSFPRTSLDVEMDMETFVNQPFSLENLLKVYGDLFKSSDYSKKQNSDWTVSRLKFITAEKYVQNGAEYIVAQNYANAIFGTVEEYRQQVSRAIDGTGEFPNDSLVGQVKKLVHPSTKTSC